MTVDVLVATYNSAHYIEEQLQSLPKQGVNLIVRDDASQDDTVERIQKYTQPFIAEKNGGVLNNFSTLLEISKAPYSCLSDGDDVWLPDKLSLSLAKMKEFESADIPVLIHTDLIVVDEQLQTLSPSYWHYSSINPQYNTLNRLLAQNVVTGCTVMINKSLRDLALPIPPNCVMHDWWLALVASAFGKIAYIDRPTVLYRQHRNNVIGAKRSLWNKNRRTILTKMHAQTVHFLQRYQGKLTSDQITLLENFLLFLESSPLRRYQLLKKYAFYKQGFLRNCLWLFI
ncbi:MAG: glycosyltransferase family 2 protein [Chlamydiia bacterium]|nr:glycosyltransferase family 2 protein [Chlamydiia bacterium]